MPGSEFALAGADVVVVGAGTGGMAAALLLADAGANVTLLERVAEPGAVGAGILLQPNGLAVLHALGLGSALAAAGRPLTGAFVRTPRGTPLVAAATPDYGRGLDHLLALRRSRLNELLLDAVAGRPAITARFGADVTAARPDGTVDVLERAVAGTLRADLVVGADGIRSVVRTGGDFAARTRPAGGPYLRGLLPTTDLDLDSEYWTALGLFGGARVDPDTLYFYADAAAPAVAAALARRDLAAVAREWAVALPLAGEILSRVPSIDELLVNEATRVDCERWADGRLVLLGDAAHAMAPTLGQGANSAIVDAAVLVNELATGRPLAAALAHYGARRRPAVRRVQDSADRLVTLSSLRNPALRLARDTALRLVGRLPGATTRLAKAVAQEDPAWLRDTVAHLRGRPAGTA